MQNVVERKSENVPLKTNSMQQIALFAQYFSYTGKSEPDKSTNGMCTLEIRIVDNEEVTMTLLKHSRTNTEHWIHSWQV